MIFQKRLAVTKMSEINSTKIKIAGMIEESIVDGPGYRFTVFVQGCEHRCKGCHNPQALDINGGVVTTIDKIISRIIKNPLLCGITISGGEPFLQAAACAILAKSAKENNLNVITYSGFTFEKLLEKSSAEPEIFRLLNFTDVLIDGHFDESKMRHDLSFRGSLNQRVIDVKSSLNEGEVVECNFEVLKNK